MAKKTAASYLIFCSFEVGGLPFQMAEILNRHGIDTYFISLSQAASGHDSVQFHYGKRKEKWILSHSFPNQASTQAIVVQLKRLYERYKFNGCLATGSRAWLLAKAGIPYHYWSFGADLDQSCFFPAWMNTYPLWKKLVKLPLFFTEKNEARRTFKKAVRVMIAPYQQASLQAICPAKELFFLPHIFSVNDFTAPRALEKPYLPLTSNSVQFERYFFSSTRHTWSGYLKKQMDNKGNDIILKAFKRYLELSKATNTALVLIEKGPAVAASKELARTLGIEDFVVWLKAMPRKELDLYYRGAFLCFGQFATPVLTYAALEPLVQGRPCISFFGSITADIPYYQELPPVYNSSDAEAIAGYIQRLSNDPAQHRKICDGSRDWIKRNCTEEIFVKKFVEAVRYP